jgi:hypothetical protein
VPVVRQESAALPDFDPTYDRYGSNSVIAAMSASLFKAKVHPDLAMSQPCHFRTHAVQQNLLIMF